MLARKEASSILGQHADINATDGTAARKGSPYVAAESVQTAEVAAG